jgi:hypothetical protein
VVSPIPVEPNVASMIVRVPQASSASTRIIGYPVPPWWPPPRRNLRRFASVSGQHIMVESIAVTNRPRQYTPLVPGPASGPRSRSNRPPQRRHADPAPCLGQRPRSRCDHPEPVQSGDHLRPHLPVTHLGEQPGGQQQVDHHPRGQVPYPRLDLAGLAQHGVDHLEGHDPGQLAQMTRAEPASGDRDDTGDDRIRGQRSSR